MCAAAALFDIEGTVSSIAFVRDVLFPYAAARMDAYVARHAGDPPVRSLLEDAAREAGATAGDDAAALRALHEWSDRDVKATPLKTLQGMIWHDGFTTGDLRSDPYADAIAALRRFHAAGVVLHVYSSGSVEAQRLFFGHTRDGDLRPLFGRYFDTTSGAKNDPQSYRTIAARIGNPPQRIIFFSDVQRELDAARSAGLQTVGLARPSDGRGTALGDHPTVASFDGIEIVP
jgi:enolase-phosphatase E1